jgi:hypothetical protein
MSSTSVGPVMGAETYRERVFEVEKWAQEQVDILASVQRKAPARGGESGAIADAAAGLQRRQRNKDRIDMVECSMQYVLECIDAEYYGETIPETTAQECRDALRLFRQRWNGRA